MLRWEVAFQLADKDKKWSGEEGFIILNDPLWVRGIRLLMQPMGRYIGFNYLNVFT